MKKNSKNNSFGRILKNWRQVKKVSQLELALDTFISTKHLSFIENGKSNPSREIILRISKSLGLSLRQVNTLLYEAGFSPEFNNTDLSYDKMQLINKALVSTLNKHEPYPAVVFNSEYDILMMNNGFNKILNLILDKEIIETNNNIYLLIFHENGLHNFFEDWNTIKTLLISRLHDEFYLTQNQKIKDLYEKVIYLAKINKHENDLYLQTNNNIPIINFSLNKNGIKLSFFSTFTTFGSAIDITTQELKIECLFPADQFTDEFLINNFNT